MHYDSVGGISNSFLMSPVSRSKAYRTRAETNDLINANAKAGTHKSCQIKREVNDNNQWRSPRPRGAPGLRRRTLFGALIALTVGASFLQAHCLFTGICVGEAAVPGPADLFSEIDAAIEYEEQLPALDESSDDEPMPPPGADEDHA